GLTAVLAAVPAAFVVVKLVGALYLAWLGWQMLRRPASPGAPPANGRGTSPFAQGAVSNLLNPKIAIFFLAVLPQFIEPAQGRPALQAAMLGLVSIASGTAVNLCTAALAGRARGWLLVQPRLFRRFQQLAGGALIGIGLKVALERVRP
ncbi:hypothetical protein DBR42_12440, partial [Pelomonas sp. HMWF004]